jgi:nitrogen fixation/metabolism regulation signal transduction histidine kinase
MLGHELRNPLAPIKTALALMRMQFPEVAGKERGIIERQVQHMVRLIDDLLDVARGFCCDSGRGVDEDLSRQRSEGQRVELVS